MYVMMATQNPPNHTLDDDALGHYLSTKIDGIKLPVKSTKIGYGQSNPTFFIDDAA